MQNASQEETIAAIATASGKAGIGIVKLSGTKAIGILGEVFRCANHKVFKSEEFKTKRLYYGKIIDAKDEGLVDEVLVGIMRAPKSYTREDVVEINSHGGRAVLEKILLLVLDHGARLAQPGEFTQRAFLNGRIDLTQAEAVVDLIEAKSRAAARLAALEIDGHAKSRYESLRRELLDIIVSVDAFIDFGDEEDHGCQTLAELNGKLYRSVIEPIRQCIRKKDLKKFMQDGMKVVIGGRPNVGKSSLLNRLVCQERAIVTAYPGTTRDVVCEPIYIKGAGVLVMDTAGIRQTADPIESVGIKKAVEAMESADVILWVRDAREALEEEEKALLEKYRQKHIWLIANKSDLIEATEESAKSSAADRTRTGFKEIATCAKNGQGVCRVLGALEGLVARKEKEGVEAGSAPNTRQGLELDACLEHLLCAERLLKSEEPAEIISIELKSALKRIDAILGRQVEEDVIREIFDRFCIGK